MCKVMSFIKNFFANSAPKFKIHGSYEASHCVVTDVIDSNILEISLKLPSLGWCKFNVLIKGLHITNKNLIPEYNYKLFLLNILKDRDINVIISNVINRHVVLEGSIYIFDYNDNHRINLRKYLTTVYTPYLIQAKPIKLSDTKKKLKKVFKAVRLSAEPEPKPEPEPDNLLDMSNSIEMKNDDEIIIDVNSDSDWNVVDDITLP